MYIFEKAPKIVNIDQHLTLKKYILFFVTSFAVISVKAQSGYNYQEWGIGGGEETDLLRRSIFKHGEVFLS